jgi:hypothetical protein
VERVSGIVFLVDAAAVDGRDPTEDLKALLRELDLYLPGLASRPALVLANKCDLPGAQRHLPNLRKFVRQLMARGEGRPGEGRGRGGGVDDDVDDDVNEDDDDDDDDESLQDVDGTSDVRRGGRRRGRAAKAAAEKAAAAAKHDAPGSGIRGIVEASMATGVGLQDAVVALRSKLLEK